VDAVTETAPRTLPARRLCGPGPTNLDARVQAAMERPILGYLDPDFIQILDEVVAMLRLVYRCRRGLALPLSSTGTAGMEAGIAALLEPGETVIVGVAGYFGRRIAELARRRGAQVVEVGASPGEQVPEERLLECLREHPEARAVAVVHAETSTGVRQSFEQLGARLRSSETLLIVDAVTSLGGIELDPERWGVDYCYSCTQKCLGAPPGMAPVWLSERALERLRMRRAPAPFTFDVELLARYWVERPPVYHHTPPALLVYALHEALRLALEEGLETRWQRHAQAGATLQAGLRDRRLELLADERVQLPQLTAVRVPDGSDGREVQRRLLREHGIEIGGSLDPAAPPVWRIGLMGVNATDEAATLVLKAIETVLDDETIMASERRSP
jgi:alanine-glyoxylate transaminase/serine-glyoxylate transaminase/serine-pyruvate transaminase